MTPDTLLTLPEDLLILPMTEIEPAMRARLDCSDDDFAITLPHSRKNSVVVDPDTAGLLERFRQPRNLVDAVLLYCLPRQIDPKKMLELYLPTVENFFARGLLVDARQVATDRAVRTDLTAGLEVQGVTIVRPVQVLEDTAVYQVRRMGMEDGGTSFGALKWFRSGNRTAVGSLENEATILGRLDGAGAPRLLGQGEIEDRGYLLLEWCSGVNARTAAEEWRRRGGTQGRHRLLALGVKIARAFGELHRKGILHGDIHPRNVLVDAEGIVTLIDFGASRCIRGAGTPQRPGVPFYFEPEHARAVLAGDRGHPTSEKGEQYAVAALLYFLFCGAYTCEFQLQRDQMLRQIVEEPPMPWGQRGLEPWPSVERLLATALAKEPAKRFPSLAALVQGLEKVLEEEAPPVFPSPPRRRLPGKVEQAADELLEATALDGRWAAAEEPPTPSASLAYGAAGVACALGHIASRRGDGELLALADVWGCQAEMEAERAEGFLNEEIGLTEERVGSISPFHSASGVPAVQAMLARGRGDWVSYERSVAGFIEAVDSPGEGLDLTLGRAGVVLLSALLQDGVPTDLRSTRLEDDGRRHLLDLWQILDRKPPLAPTAPLGMAHGWAGYLYATLHWCRATGDPLPPHTERRLHELADLADPAGRGLCWRWGSRGSGNPRYMPGWCNGSAGFVFLWTLAARLLEEPRYLELAQGAAWDTWEDPDSTTNLCCGLVGRSYALLNLYRATEDPLWLARARDLAEWAAREGSFEDDLARSLHKGRLGLAVLASDLERPLEAAMPFFEDEGWPRMEALRAPAAAESEAPPAANPRLDPVATASA
jgi:serine/threonine-protein kinase